MAEKLLAHLGIKVTKQRVAIIHILEKATKPLTAEAIYDQLVDKELMNYSTVYRTLNMLSEKNALIKTGEPGGKMCFQLKKHQHTHALECLECHEHIIIDRCPVETFTDLVNQTTGFVVTEHSLQLKGLCANCVAHQEKKK